MSKKILIINNSDKKSNEKWSSKPDSLACFPHPFRMCILGLVDSGKSMIARNILIYNQMSKKPFKNVYIIHGDKNTEEWNDIDPTQILDGADIPEVDFWIGNKDKSLIIIDDIEFENMKKKNKQSLTSLFRLVSSHHNYSIILLHQSWFSVLPIIKKCSNIFIIFKPNDLDELVKIGRRVGLKKDEIIDLFKYVKSKYDNITIDMTDNTPAKYRLNIFEVIEKSV